MRKHCDSIRDRLIVNFERQNMHHKPKLIAVAGFSKGAGTSTLASGLAAALSETGEGKVLLVDMNVGEGEVHPFFEGRPSSSLAAVLESNGACQAKPAGENLYLATVNSPDTRNMPLGLRRFYGLMPVIKATDFDYVIFDMPVLSQTSPTLGMAGFMDKLLLVVESERSSPETIRRSHSELLDSRVDTSYVMNKVRSYAPKWVESDN
jgi:Mrp family chromosome partitioning ATPase